jgi:hypothetical protein
MFILVSLSQKVMVEYQAILFAIREDPVSNIGQKMDAFSEVL